ncbi:MAG: YcjF family protein [Betaproteobacteria bacterium]
MNPTEQRALLAIALLAALADGSKADAERAELRRVADSLGPQLNAAAVLQDVLLKRVDVAAAAAQLTSPELRQLAFELAVGVCDADGLRNDPETRFLAALGSALGLTAPQMAQPAATADALATAPLATAPEGEAPVVAATPRVNEAELDKTIVNASILNGALELLPQSMASLAIIPLQMRLVYRIGQAYGYELDRGHIKDFLATAGVGLTGQYLEDVGRKLIGGLLGKAAGKMAGSLARGATGVAFSFATTYALGHLAKRYYAGGRVMSTDLLRSSFNDLLGQAPGGQQQDLPQIEQRARTIDMGQIVQLVRESK